MPGFPKYLSGFSLFLGSSLGICIHLFPPSTIFLMEKREDRKKRCMSIYLQYSLAIFDMAIVTLLSPLHAGSQFYKVR